MGTSKTTWRHFFASRWFMGLAIFVLVMLIVGYLRAYYQNYQIQQEIKQLQAEAAHLESKRIQTLDLLNYVKSPAYVEEKARTELNLVKDGEHMAIVNNGTEARSSRQTETTMVQSSRLTNPLKWWNYFFH
jgi:cell division protein FtsB